MRPTKSSTLFGNEMFLSIGITLVLWNSGRFIANSIGAGEIIIAIVIYASLIKIFANLNKIRVDNIGKNYAFLVTLYFLVIVFPMTLLNYGNVNGVSILENFAYLLCCFLILIVSILEFDIDKLMRYSIIYILLFVLLVTGFGGDGAYYDDRLLGPSSNPNRLALYMLCLIVLLFQVSIFQVSKSNFFIRFIFLAICIAITISSGSDAAMLGIVLALINFIFFSLYRSILLAPILYLSIFLFLVWIILNIDFVILLMQQLWYAASTSNIRVNLLINGVNAWLDNPISFFFGFGAGAFSGYVGPFNNWESHSTIIDILSIAGIFGAILFYFPAIYASYNFIRSNRVLAASAVIGLIIFTLFGFMARHPILWLTFYISMMNAKNALEIYRLRKSSSFR